MRGRDLCGVGLVGLRWEVLVKAEWAEYERAWLTSAELAGYGGQG